MTSEEADPDPADELDEEVETIEPGGGLDDVKDAVAELLNVVGIERFIIVDEDFEASLEGVIGTLRSMGENALEFGHFGEVDLSDEPENWIADLTDRWGGLSLVERASASEEVMDSAKGSMSAPPELNMLLDVMPDSVQVDSLTPAQWSERQESVVESAGETPTLVLFDRAMHGDDDAGLRLVTALFEADQEEVMWVGLLTNTATVSNELRVRNALADQVGVTSERFVLLSKEHLNEDRVTFAEALRIALMSQPAAKLLEAVAESITQKTKAAVERLLSLSPAEFDRIVFGLSQEEGSWEIDMLLRLFDAYLRSDVRSELHTDESVQQHTKLLRTLNSLAEGPPIKSSQQACEIHRRDLYDEGAHLTAVSAPIELGDLFAKANGKDFIVLAQPCDLMVRRSGQRAPKLSFITLLPVEHDRPSDIRTGFKLPAFRDGESWWVLFNRPFLVPAEALDFCVFDPDGCSVAPETSAQGAWRLPSWTARRDALLSECGPLRASIGDGKTAEDEVLTSIRARYGVRRECVVKPVLDVPNKNFGFGLKRTGRLLPPLSRALLTTFGAHQARDGFDRAIA